MKSTVTYCFKSVTQSSVLARDLLNPYIFSSDNRNVCAEFEAVEIDHIFHDLMIAISRIM